MTDSLNSMAPLDLPPEPDPLDDPLLAALESSIVNPPSLAEPLFPLQEIQDTELIDEGAARLGQLETQIEANSTRRPLPDILPSQQDPAGLVDGLLDSQAAFLPDLSVGPQAITDGNGVPPGPPLLTPYDRPRGGSRRRGRPPARRSGVGRSGRTLRRTDTERRYCGDRRDVVPLEICEACDKYRHWPEGTNNEPRDCWHDWQQRRSPEEELDEGADEEY